MQFLIKIAISALLIAAISEIAKRFSWIAAILASLPLTSIVALCWLYFETKDTGKVALLSKEIFWAVIPSLLFFILFPAFLTAKIPFWGSLVLAMAGTATGYFVYWIILSRI